MKGAPPRFFYDFCLRLRLGRDLSVRPVSLSCASNHHPYFRRLSLNDRAQGTLFLTVPRRCFLNLSLNCVCVNRKSRRPDTSHTGSKNILKVEEIRFIFRFILNLYRFILNL